MIESHAILSTITDINHLEQVSMKETLQIEKRQRRIQKQKKKLLLHFSNHQSRVLSLKSFTSTNPIISSLEYEQMNLLKHQNSSFKMCLVQLPTPYRHINEILQFLFNGFINVEITEIDTYSLTESYGIRIESVEKRNGYYSANHYPFSFSTLFDNAVQLLESQQDIQSFELAQDLKIYKTINQQNCDLAQKFRKISIETHIPNHIKDIIDLSTYEQRRKVYRDQYTDAYIKSNLKYDDFFFCCDGGINFEDGSIQPSKFRMSQNIFALMGIDDSNIDSFLVRHDAFSRMIPYHSRKRLTMGTLKVRIDNSVPYAMQKQHILHAFEIRTIDNISILCDVLITKRPIEFPEELNIINEHSEFNPLNELEYLQSIHFLITCDHLDQVLSARAAQPKQLNTQIEDFEYSILSSLFIERYYEKEMKELFPGMRYTDIEQDRRKQIKQLKKTCGYRKIIY